MFKQLVGSMKNLTRNFFLFLLVLVSSNFVQAENFSVFLQGKDLEKLAALELKFVSEPTKSFLLQENIELYTKSSSANGQELLIPISDDDIFYKGVDRENFFMRVFFAKSPALHNLLIKGSLSRNNYIGPINVKIADSVFISDFSSKIDPKTITTKLDIITDEGVLTYLGISKAKIFGPEVRIFEKTINITVGEIEAYGFTLDAKITNPKINGFKAKIIDDNMVTANITLTEDMINNNLDIILELEVGNQKITKKVGYIHIVESLLSHSPTSASEPVIII